MFLVSYSHAAAPHCSSFSSEEDDDWCPPLPARTYLMDASREELSSVPSKPDAATLKAFSQRDTHKPTESPRLQHFDLLARHHLSSQVSQSNPNLFSNTKARDASEVYHTSQWADNFKGETLDKGQFELNLMRHIFGNCFPGGSAQPHSVMYNLVYDVSSQKEFVHENHVSFIQSAPQCSFVFSKCPEDDITVLPCQGNLLLQLASPALQPRHTDPGVRRKRPRRDKSSESCTAKQV